MQIGIAYDTQNMYNLGTDDKLHRDFATIEDINTIRLMIESIGYRAILLGNTECISRLIKDDTFNCDLVYNTVEGVRSRNREGLLPALCEIHNIPYIGTDAFGLSLTLNKMLTKMLAEHLGILTPKYFSAMTCHSPEYIRELLKELHMPVIIKPNFEGNSSGICVCNTLETAMKRIIYLLEAYKTPILCEEFIFGREITVPIIGNDPDDVIFGVTTVDIQRSDDFWLDADIKLYGDYRNILLNLPDAKTEEFKNISTEMFREIGCRDFARFDYRLTKTGEIYFIEVNPLPSLFVGGSFDVVGKEHGYTFAETIELIIRAACDRLSIPRI